MMDQQSVMCHIRHEVVGVTYVAMRQGKGAKARLDKRPLSCDHAAQCPKSSFCRLVNPLTTRLPFDLDVAAVTPPTTPDAGHQAS